MKYLYTLLYRPPSFNCLPNGWDLVERPHVGGFDRRNDLPVSQHTFGVISYERELSAVQVEDFQLKFLGVQE